MPLESQSHWHSFVRDDFYLRQTKADWELGHYFEQTLYYCDMPFIEGDEEGFVYTTREYYAVEIEWDALQRVLGLPPSVPIAVNRRATKFDWEAAFADVAAELYHNVQFHDLGARGVQSEIANLLRSSFDSRRLPIPSDESLKAKAKILLGALRGKIP